MLSNSLNYEHETLDIREQSNPNDQDALPKEKFIMEKVKEEGFLVVERKVMRFTRRVAERFYERHRNKASWTHLQKPTFETSSIFRTSSPSWSTT